MLKYFLDDLHKKLINLLIVIFIFLGYLFINIGGNIIKDIDISLMIVDVVVLLYSGILFYYITKNEETIKIKNKYKIFTSSILLSVCIIMIGSWLTDNISDPNMILYQESMSKLSASTILFSVVILAPVTEELVFRGLMFKFLRKEYSFIIAAFISTLVFSLVHGTIVHIIPTIIMGIFFCYIYEITNNIIYNIICHSLYNISVLLLSLINYSINIPLLCLYIILLLLILLYISQKLKKEVSII